MNKLRPFERLSGLLAFVLCCLLYGLAGLLVVFLMQRPPVEHRPAAGLPAVNLNFAQIELKSVESPPLEPVQPDPVQVHDPVVMPEPAEVALETRPDEPVPEPEPVLMAELPVEQEASAPELPAITDAPLAGELYAEDARTLAIARVRAMVEKEKYYPEAARRSGYTGRFRVVIRLAADGSIGGYSIEERRGHPLLGRAVETALGRIQGQRTGIQLPEALDVPLSIEFELN